MRTKILAAFLLFAICVMPGSKAGFFNGLPLSALEITLAFLFFVALIGTSWDTTKPIRRAVLFSLIFFLLLQFLSYKFLPSGWSVCLWSDAALSGLHSVCEPSAETPSGERSFIYSDINFDQNNFPLYFFNNSNTFNFFRKSEPDRNTLPFTLEAQTYLYPKEAEKLIVKGDENILIRINDKELTYTDTNRKRAYNLVPNEMNHIYLKYEARRNAKNILHVETPSNVFYSSSDTLKTGFWISAYKITNALLLAILAFCFVFSFISKVKALEKKDQHMLVTSGIFLALFFLLTHSGILDFKRSFIPFSILLILSSLYYVFRDTAAKQKIVPFLFIILFFNVCILTTVHVTPEEAVIFSGGNDELGHESFSRATFLVTSFNDFIDSTEKGVLYYYQPLHRYFLAFFHIALGEPMWGPYLAQTFIFSLAFIFCVFALYSLLGGAASMSFSLIYFVLLSYDITSPLALLQTPYQQAVAFPLVVLAIAQMLFLLKKSEIRWIDYFLFGVNWGAIFMIRTDWLPLFPGIILFLVFKFYQPKFKITAKRTLLLFAIGLTIFPFLIGLRNYYAAGTFAVMPTSGFVNLLPKIKTALGQKIDFHEHSTATFVVEITQAFHGRYSELVGILWKNIYDHIIKTSIVRQFLWLVTGVLSLLNIIYIARRRQWQPSAALICLLVSFVSLVFVSSFFGQHNGIAMFAVYDFLVTILLAINIPLTLNQLILSGYLFTSSKKKISNKELSSFLQSNIPKNAGLIDRVKIGYRPYICPFGELLELIPERAAVFDIGCGSGMFLSLVSKFKHPRALGGIEISQKLIDNAETLLGDLDNATAQISLQTFDGQDVPQTIASYDYIFLIDVIHHIPQENQIGFLESIYEKMSSGSKLILKDIDAGRPILSKFNRLHDLLLSGETGHELRSEYTAGELVRIGFTTSPTIKKRTLVYPHYTIICEKK